MKKTRGWFILGILLFISVVFSASGADLDPNYVKQFGNGVLLASSKGLPQKDKYNADQFDFRDAKFFAPGGEGATLDFRAILPEGKTYKMYLDELKTKKADEAKTQEEDVVAWHVWVSNDKDGTQLAKEWPTKAGELPSWAPAIFFYTVLEDHQKTFNTIAFSWNQIIHVSTLGDWFKSAKPGYKLFIGHSTGFLHQPQEQTTSETVRIASSSGDGHNHEAGAGITLVSPMVTCTVEIVEKK